MTEDALGGSLLAQAQSKSQKELAMGGVVVESQFKHCPRLNGSLKGAANGAQHGKFPNHREYPPKSTNQAYE
jgi:hypothetical protein